MLTSWDVTKNWVIPYQEAFISVIAFKDLISLSHDNQYAAIFGVLFLNDGERTIS